MSRRNWCANKNAAKRLHFIEPKSLDLPCVAEASLSITSKSKLSGILEPNSLNCCLVTTNIVLASGPKGGILAFFPLPAITYAVGKDLFLLFSE